MATLDSSRIKRSVISAAFLSLRGLPSMTVVRSNDLKTVSICSGYQFVPNFTLEWSDYYQHYRVYADIASSSANKQRAGYAICRIRNAITASFFVTIVHFLLSHRARAEVA